MTFLDRVPLDEISERARRVNVARLLLSLVAGFFYVIGWLAGMVVLGIVWCCVAVKVGFVEARAKHGPAE